LTDNLAIVDINYFVLGVAQRIVTSMSVCPDAYLKNYGPKFIKFSLYLTVAVADSSHGDIPYTPNMYFRVCG